jgi:serine/threonine protein kinase
MSDIIGMMLQTNPTRRSSCDELLKHDILMRRTNPTNENVEKNIRIEQPMQLLGTIKLPKNLNDINQKLPKMKMYIRER